MKNIFILFLIILVSKGILFSQTSPACQPTITNACTPFFPMGPPSFYINNFTLNGTSFSSSCSEPPNINTTIFTNSNLMAGSSYAISISTFSFFPPMGFSHSIWLDANDDGDFNDIGEQLLPSTISFSSILNENITIPTSSISGLVHMRIISSS